MKMTVAGAKAIQAEHLFAGHQDRACGATAYTRNFLPEDLKFESRPSIDPPHVPAVAPVTVGSAIPGKADGPAADQPTPDSEQEEARRLHAGSTVISGAGRGDGYGSANVAMTKPFDFGEPVNYAPRSGGTPNRARRIRSSAALSECPVMRADTRPRIGRPRR